MKPNSILKFPLTQKEYYSLEGFCWGILNHYYIIRDSRIYLFIQTNNVGDVIYNDEECSLKELNIFIRQELGCKSYQQLNIQLYCGCGRIVGHYTDECTSIKSVIQSLYPVIFTLDKSNATYSCNCSYVA